MKCPNPLCDNAALEDSHAFCFKCGLKLKGRATSNDTGRDVSSDDENPTPNQDLSSDSGETAGGLASFDIVPFFGFIFREVKLDVYNCSKGVWF